MRTLDKRMRLSRRRFLQTGAVAAAGTMAASGGILVVDPNGAWAMSVRHLKPGTMATLVRMVRDIYPHDHIGDGFYAKAVEPYDAKAGEDAALRTLIEDGVAALDAMAKEDHGRLYTEINAEEARVALLQRIADTPFFQRIRSDLVTGLYNQPEIWAKFGYEGPSAQFGGYINRGFNDLDWIDEA